MTSLSGLRGSRFASRLDSEKIGTFALSGMVAAAAMSIGVALVGGARLTSDQARQNIAHTLTTQKGVFTRGGAPFQINCVAPGLANAFLIYLNDQGQRAVRSEGIVTAPAKVPVAVCPALGKPVFPGRSPG